MFGFGRARPWNITGNIHFFVICLLTFRDRRSLYQIIWNVSSVFLGECVITTAPCMSFGYSWYQVPIHVSLAGRLQVDSFAAYSNPII
jgi:hypothetical protein